MVEITPASMILRLRFPTYELGRCQGSASRLLRQPADQDQVVRGTLIMRRRDYHLHMPLDGRLVRTAGHDQVAYASD